MYLWRAVDDEGEVLDVLVQARRDKDAALRLMRKLLKNQELVPASIVTDRYRAYDAALRDLGLSGIHHRGKRLNNRAEARTCRSDDESERSKVFDLPAPCNVSFPATRPVTTPSMSAVI
jgi:transposase-like protein